MRSDATPCTSLSRVHATEPSAAACDALRTMAHENTHTLHAHAVNTVNMPLHLGAYKACYVAAHE